MGQVGEPKHKCSVFVCMLGVWVGGSQGDIIIQTGADVWGEEQELAVTTPTCLALVMSGYGGYD